MIFCKNRQTVSLERLQLIWYHFLQVTKTIIGMGFNGHFLFWKQNKLGYCHVQRQTPLPFIDKINSNSRTVHVQFLELIIY